MLWHPDKSKIISIIYKVGEQKEMAESKRTLAEIEAEIAAVKEELNDVHGTETEVYARIVGYYRAVRNWNKGKRDEFNNRRLFVYNGSDADISEPREVINMDSDCKTKSEAVVSSFDTDTTVHYDFFMRKTCPNCPPVKTFMAGVSFEGRVIDVDTDEGLRDAASKGVFSAPTVIFYDQNNNEIGRGHNVEEIEAVLTPESVIA